MTRLRFVVILSKAKDLYESYISGIGFMLLPYITAARQPCLSLWEV